MASVIHVVMVMVISCDENGVSNTWCDGDSDGDVMGHDWMMMQYVE